MAVIGTAGHIDHGKSTLVRALTSIDPDRLPEEKLREMTIDLGFAWLKISNGEMVGIVDVPGHEDFVRNMIAGVGGIDATILVIAQDDGWMPQTEEHLQILNLLGIKDGIIALTKVDLNTDPDWLDLVEQDIRDKLRGSTLANAPIVRVSSKTGTNLELLKQKIEELVSNLRTNLDVGKPRLPIDRVFSIKGSGVVVTGTLVDGSLNRGDEVYIFPVDATARIRTIESYKQKLEEIQAGTRVALNIVGLEKEGLSRGNIIFKGKEQVIPSKAIAVNITLIRELNNPLKTETEYKIYLGTRELNGLILLIGKEFLGAGETAYAQIRFKEPIATRLGDHFIIRRVSPSETMGGGTILDPLAIKRQFRNLDKVIPFLERRTHLQIEELILSELEKNRYMEEKNILVSSHYSAESIAKSIESLVGQHKLVRASPWVLELSLWQDSIDTTLRILAKEHAQHPSEKGLRRAELQSQLRFPIGLFNQLVNDLVASGKIVAVEGILALTGHKPSLSEEQTAEVTKLLQYFAKNRDNPPTRKDILDLVPNGESIIRYMSYKNLIVELSEGVIFESTHYDNIKKQVTAFLKRNNSLTIQDMRQLLGFSRKYIIPLLNKLEEEGILRRKGEQRFLVEKQISR
jgi:selenocysteine-specific elongation factor